jgi:hypothetical protein
VKELALLQTWIRDGTPFLYDVFDPSLVSTALKLDHDLGHLIYGPKLWKERGGVHSDGADPLTKFFRAQGIFFWVVISSQIG